MKVIITSNVYGYYNDDGYYEDGIKLNFDNLESALPLIRMVLMQNKYVVIGEDREVE